MISDPSDPTIPRRIFWSLFVVLAAHVTFWGPNSDTMSRNIASLAVSLGSDHAITIDRFVLNMPGGADQFNDKAHFRGHYYSGIAPGGSILLAPIGLASALVASAVYQRATGAAIAGSGSLTREGIELLLVQLLGTLLVVIPLTAWAWTRLYRYLTEELQLEARVSGLAVVAGALCSNLTFYSTYVSGKQIAAMLGLLAFTFACRTRSGEHAPLRLAWAGFFTGAAVATEYTMAVFAICLFAYIVWAHSWRESLRYALGGVVWAVILGWYHTAAFGNPLFTSYHYRWVTAAKAGHTSTPPFDRFSLQRLWGMTLSTYKGILIYTPWYIIALAGFWQGLSLPAARRTIWTILAIIAGFLLMLSFSPVWYSGGWGMRYLVPIFPYFAIGFALWLGDAHRTVRGRRLAYALIAISLVINFLPFGAGEASNVDPLWSAPILYVARHLVEHGYSLYTVDFISRNIRPLSRAQDLLFHLAIYATMLGGLALIWRGKFRSTAQRVS